MRVMMVSANTEQINMPVLPIGMAQVAAATEQAGHTVQVINLLQSEGHSQKLSKSIKKFDPDIFGISVRNIDDQNRQAPKFLLPPVKEIIDECRQLISSPIVLGGPGYSIFPHPVLTYLRAEYGIRGEGEKAFPELLDRLASNESVVDVPGIILPNKKSGPPPQRIRILDAYPLPKPEVHLKVPDDVDSSHLWIPFQTRRGCPMKCSYCSTPAIEGTLMRHQSVQAAVENLAAYKVAGYKRFFFVDNIFNLPPSYAESLCEAIIEADLDIVWQAIIYPFNLKPSLVKKMARAGCTGVALGFESGNPKILSSMNKRFGPEDIKTASNLFKEFSIFQMGFLLLGGPGEPRNSVEESIEFAKSLNLNSVKLTSGIRIYPDTALAHQAIEEGMINPRSDLLYPTFYLQPSLDGWLQERVAKLVEQEPEYWHM